MSENGNEYGSARERAEVLQLDACLHELAGVGPAAGLAARIVAACEHAAPAAVSLARPASRWWWAAALLAGVGAVGGAAWWRAERHAAAPVQEPKRDLPQEPQPAPAPAPLPVEGPITLICDYSDNLVLAVDADGKEVFRLDECFGVWDAELLPNGNVLVTEFSVSRVREVTQAGKTVWTYENLKNPYAAHRMTVGSAAGHTLIADTFGGRVLDVRPDGTVFWSYGDHEHEDIRPFDVEQTPTGSILIADPLGDRVIEIDYHGNVLWQVKDLPSIHDADRLPNGNTLVTLRNKGEVRELDRDGKVVWQLKGLSSPSDADRLSNGNTLVAENTAVREYDRDGKVVWEKHCAWAVEANRYQR